MTWADARSTPRYARRSGQAPVITLVSVGGGLGPAGRPTMGPLPHGVGWLVERLLGGMRGRR
jgi:hypothetical protein